MLRRGERGAPPDLARRLAEGSTHLGDATVHGRLIDLQGFQALQTGGTARVPGELLHVRDATLWDALDAYEGVGEAGWYQRELVVALDRDGQPRSAWSYTAPGREP